MKLNKFNELYQKLLFESAIEDLKVEVVNCKTIDEFKKHNDLIKQTKDLNDDEYSEFMKELFNEAVKNGKKDHDLMQIFLFLKRQNNERKN